MKARSTLKPGQHGTLKLSAQYGEQLLYVRYRYDPLRKKRLKTVELIIEERDWEPERQFKPDQIVSVRVDLDETEYQQKLRDAGGVWNRRRRVWEARYDIVCELQLEARIVFDDEDVRSAGGVSGEV